MLGSLVLGSLAGCSGSGGGSGGVAPATSATSATSGSGVAPAVAVPTQAGGTATSPAPSTPLFAGASRVDATPPIGVPLAGFGGGDRRHKPIPNLNPFAFDHFLMPSVGTLDPICARALYVSDGKEKICIVTIDAIATTSDVVETAWKKAQAQGATVPLDHIMACSSHSHSGPGCMTHLWFWQLTAADLFSQQVFDGFTDAIAKAMVEAERGAIPAAIGVGTTQLAGVTHNRRSGSSKVFTGSSIDPELLVVRVDPAAGGPAIATLWNFAIHGISLGEDNHLFSGDIMGGANGELESRNAGVSLFVNSAEGDITPDGLYRHAGIATGGKVLADAVLATRANTPVLTSLEVRGTSETVDFGQPSIDVTQGRLGNQGAAMLQQAGWATALQKLGLGIALGANVSFPAGWIEQQFRYTAFRLGKWGFSSIPGEAIHTIGLDLKQRGKTMGFEHVLTCGLANGHMAYITTEQEYWFGGYEALATFWGPKTGEKLVDSCARQMMRVKP